ncbi:sensor histidine kinase [Haloimpatiens sp. FM7315]|uniref:sensor histidine kinase n=1 Tax=Haloimpatiens sp. FM7315 TaxID=3298609 RepID=UPI00370C0DCE
MIRKFVRVFLKYKIWLSLILFFNVMSGVFLWLMDSNSFTYIFPTFIIGSILLYSLIGFLVYGKDKRKKEEIIGFIESLDLKQEEVCLDFLQDDEKEIIHIIAAKLRKEEELIKKQELNLKEYEEYIEVWAHEIKTPVALMTFVLDNRKEEISPKIYQKLEYARSEMQEDIERILYYSRVKSEHLDYIFEEMSLYEICKDVEEEYKSLLEEQKISVYNNLGNIKILSDKKGLCFVLRQIFSNSIKYRDLEKEESFIEVSSRLEEENIILIIRDNGIGAKPYDLAFLFDKGFTGDAGTKTKKSTGMGLYLAKKVANNLKIKIEVTEDYKDGFEMSLSFPVVK